MHGGSTSNAYMRSKSPAGHNPAPESPNGPRAALEGTYSWMPPPVFPRLTRYFDFSLSALFPQKGEFFLCQGSIACMVQGPAGLGVQKHVKVSQGASAYFPDIFWGPPAQFC